MTPQTTAPSPTEAPRTAAEMRRARALRWTAYTALAIAFAVLCVFLSNWQFSRNDERSAQLALVDANYDQDPVSISQVLGADGSFDPADEWLPVTLQGEYIADGQVLARNRAHGGTAAFEVLVPFRLDDGRVFIVNRGWLPPGSKQALPDEIPAPPTGETTVVVRLRPSEQLPSSGRGAPEGQVPTINLPTVAESTGADTITSAYGLLVSESPAVDRPRAPEAPTEDPGPHLSYAIQWILFAIMGFVFIGYVIRSEIRHNREDAADAALAAAAAEAAGDDTHGAAAPAPAAPAPRPIGARRHARKRDRDTIDEDAILDAQGRS